MKFHWGFKIAALYIGFVLMILGLVFKSVSQDFYLVQEDYYEQELVYENRIEKLRNVQLLGEKPKVVYDEDMQAVTIQFPTDMQAEGKIWLYYPQNANYDLKLPLELNAEQLQVLPASKLPKGLWKVKLDWESDGKGYYVENVVML